MTTTKTNANMTRKTHYYGTPRQEIGRETDGGTVVIFLSDSAIEAMRIQAWNLSNVHDLRVLELERDSRLG